MSESIPRLQAHYRDYVVGALCETLGYSNPLAAPRLEKIVLNMGVGRSSGDFKSIDAERGRKAGSARDELGQIAGQRPVITRARKSIANFKLREGQPNGVKVTLRRRRMYEFFDRLITIALPRIRDFRGVPEKSLDGHGNCSIGIREHIVFPEIDYDRIESIHGFDIAIVTTASTDREARVLLEAFNLPFSDE